MVFRRAAAFVVLLALLVAGLAVPATAAGWLSTTVTFTSGGLTRTYLVDRPASPGSAPLPVVVELHGCCTTPSFELTRSGFRTAARGAILVFPAGYDKVWNAGACCGNSQVDDVSFIAAVVQRVLAAAPRADPSRVYLVGYSNGGRMAYRMACERPGLFAAVAVFGAVDAFPCAHRSPVPILLAGGTEDPELVFAYGFPHVVNGYVEPTLTQEAHEYALSGAPVVLRRYSGAGHGWPAGMAAVMWRFFTGPATAGDRSRV